jgi:spermidine/putrescine transport system permease protein
LKKHLREVQFGEQMTAARHLWRSFITSGPAILWVTVFLLIPLIAIGVISFLSRGVYGEVQLPFTSESYRRFMGFGLLGFDPLYPMIVVRSFILGAATTILCVVAAVPLAFFIAGLPVRLKNTALLLVVIPFWTNLLIRTYAWQIIFAADGWLAGMVARLGWCPPGTPLYPGAFAVYVGMVCDYMPFMVLPIYASVEKIDWSIAEAAMDLGADNRRVFWHALLPQIGPGLVAGVVLVFIPATGQYVIPDLLGGAKTVMLGNAVAQQFGPSRDWPFGSAIAFLGMGLVMFGLWAYARFAAEKGQESLL